jgi:MFS family permease
MMAFACTTFCTRILFFLVAFEIAKHYPYDPLYLGMLGLVQAIPALSLAVVGGHVADRFNRRNLLLCTVSIQVLCAFGLLLAERYAGGWLLGSVFAVMFFLGVARGFAEPAMPSLEAIIVPREAAVSAATWGTLVWHAIAVIAPVFAGYVVYRFGTQATFMSSVMFGMISLLALSQIKSNAVPTSHPDEPLLQSLTAGWRYVAKTQILWTAMALDLFAVLFGGAVAMLPLFAQHVLHVDAVGLGYLNAAPYFGALVTAIVCMRFPPRANAGIKLLVSVFGFGICMIVFALSTNIVLSCVALFGSGLLDGLSVVIRKSILRLYSPDHMRGRVAAVSSIFIGASNELGELESGIAAHYLGLVRSVWLGGIATLAVVSGVAFVGKELRKFEMKAREL